MRVVVAEDGVLLREGYVRLLGEAGLQVVGAVGDAEALLAVVAEDRPDVATIRMPPTYTMRGCAPPRRCSTRNPPTAVLVLSQSVESGAAVRLLGDGRAERGLPPQGARRRGR